MGQKKCIIVIDGLCVMCNSFLSWVLHNDKDDNYLFTNIQSNFYKKNIPLCGVLGGGYNKNFEKLIELHSMLHKNCAKVL